jgi:hypothetical protein
MPVSGQRQLIARPCSIQIACSHYAYEYGVDRAEETGWKWPF